jgi:predicted dehydrogenase
MAYSDAVEFVAIADESQEALQAARSECVSIVRLLLVNLSERKFLTFLFLFSLICSLKMHECPPVESYTNYKDLLARDDIEWVMIGSKVF